jgi:hypothetical protein
LARHIAGLGYLGGLTRVTVAALVLAPTTAGTGFVSADISKITVTSVSTATCHGLNNVTGLTRCGVLQLIWLARVFQALREEFHLVHHAIAVAIFSLLDSDLDVEEEAD